MATSCCPTDKDAVVPSWDPKLKGTVETINGSKVYFSGSGPHGIVIVYDIYGWDYPQTKQVADRLAAAGFYVAVPDLLGDNVWPLAKNIPDHYAEFQAWLGDYCDWDKNIKPLVSATMDKMKTDGVEKMGTIGFCWGTKMAMLAATEGMSIAVGSAHPSFLTTELAEKVNAPVIVLPSMDEAPLDDVMAVFAAKPFGASCVFKKFPEMHHGWCAARGDYSDPKQAAQAAEAVDMFIEFFTKILKA